MYLRLSQIAVLTTTLFVGSSYALTLSDSVQLMQRNSADARTSRLTSEIEKLSEEQVKAGLMPQVSMTSSFGVEKRKIYENTDGDNSYDRSDTNNFAVNVNQVLYNGELFSQVEESEINSRVAELGSDAQIEALRIQLIADYFELAKLVETRALLKKDVATQQSLLVANEAKYKRGLIREVEVLTAKAGMTETQSLIQSTTAQIKTIQRRLERLTREPLKTVYGLPERGHKLLRLDMQPEDLLMFARNNKKSLLAAKQSVLLAEQRVESANKKYLPKLDLTASHTRSGYDHNIPGGTDEVDDRALTTAAINLSWDLFNGGATGAQVASAQKAKTIADLAYEEENLRFAEALDNALTQLGVLEAQVAALNARMALQTKNYNDIKTAFKSGLANQEQYLAAQKEYFGAVAQVKYVQYDYYNALIAVYNEAGLFSDDRLNAMSNLFTRPLDI